MKYFLKLNYCEENEKMSICVIDIEKLNDCIMNSI